MPAANLRAHLMRPMTSIPAGIKPSALLSDSRYTGLVADLSRLLEAARRAGGQRGDDGHLLGTWPEHRRIRTGG
jgi:hypothetical protein